MQKLTSMLIGKWIDHFNCFGKKGKIKAEYTSRVGTPVRLSIAEIRFLGKNLVVKSISQEYKNGLVILGVLACSVVIWSCSPKPQDQVGHPNVLFIVVDDLRPVLGCYGTTSIHTPSIDGLASSGVLFENAYCQEAVCNPSRASVMTGLRPDRLKVWTLKPHFREENPDVVTLPQLFKNNGYATREIGKIYHDGAAFKDPLSWSGPSYYHVTKNEAGHKYFLDENLIPDRSKAAATEMADVPDSGYIDGKVADKAVELLGELKDSSFFLAVGFRRPHLPFTAPKKYWDMYQREDMKHELLNEASPEGTPKLAFTNSNELRGYEDIGEAEIPLDKKLELLHGYYASTTYVDAQIGKLLQTLKDLNLDKNTIIVLWSDHGYHLGDFGIWCKSTNFEAATRVPLIFAGPGVPKGKKESGLVELLDVYPTVSALSGLHSPGDIQGENLESLWRESKDSKRKDFALSQFVRPYAAVNQVNPPIMGYSIRTEEYRFTEWRSFPDMKVMDRELYRLSDDRVERQNLANNPANNKLMDELALKIDQERNRKNN